MRATFAPVSRATPRVPVLTRIVHPFTSSVITDSIASGSFISTSDAPGERFADGRVRLYHAINVGTEIPPAYKNPPCVRPLCLYRATIAARSSALYSRCLLLDLGFCIRRYHHRRASPGYHVLVVTLTLVPLVTSNRQAPLGLGRFRRKHEILSAIKPLRGKYGLLAAARVWHGPHSAGGSDVESFALL